MLPALLRDGIVTFLSRSFLEVTVFLFLSFFLSLPTKRKQRSFLISKRVGKIEIFHGTRRNLFTGHSILLSPVYTDTL